MIMTLYSVAILCTRLIGHGSVIGEDADEDLQKIKDIKVQKGSASKDEACLLRLSGTQHLALLAHKLL